MTPRSVSDPLVRDAPLLRADERVDDAVRQVLDSGLPALPVVDARSALCGIFGEREFMGALFPGYLKELTYAGFVPRALEDALQKRAGCRTEPVRNYMNTEHIDVDRSFSDAQVAEVFLHHRVLILPVAENREVIGVITRSDFFRALADRFLATQ
jgi:CBS domain-containing protein